jgi:peptide/nickel transport system ATP-binding protein
MEDQLTTKSESLAEGPLLSIRNLSVKYSMYLSEATAIDHVNLEIKGSKIVALVGESGCGKSTLGLAIIGLLPNPPARIDEGEILFRGVDLLKMKVSQKTKMRGTGISMIFQDPMSSLDPVYTVGQQLTEALNIRDSRESIHDYGPFKQGSPSEISHNSFSRLIAVRLPAIKRQSKVNREVVDALRNVQINDPDQVVDKYPYELSGGMAQRVMIAQALLQKPSLLIADEPTSALDVTTQAQVIELMRALRDEIDTSIIFITHDLAVAAQIADEVVVMYAGQIMEHSYAQDLFDNPLHPYTEALLQSFPRSYKGEGRLKPIGGDVPNLRNPLTGCPFHPRCPYAFDRCRTEKPALVGKTPGHKASCFLRY